MAEIIHDRLYGQFTLTKNEKRLCQTKEMARLRHVSLSAIPCWFLNTGVCASKAEHSLGALHIAKVVGENPRSELKEIAPYLRWAILTHDLGTPPFAHASEPFQIKILGKNHEQMIGDVLDGSEFAHEVKNQGGSIDKVIRMVKGEDGVDGELINGTIDLDNLDNTLRYALSMGLILRANYNPHLLARAFTKIDGQIVILPGFQDELKGWEECRQETYKYVYSASNLSPGSMLFRAIDLAARADEIKADFFSKTDAQAFDFLSEQCNPQTQTLMDMAYRSLLYPQVFDLITHTPTEALKKFVTDPDNQGILADYISSQLNCSPEEVCVYLGKNKGFKQIHFPILNEDGSFQKHQPSKPLSWMAKVFVHPKLVFKRSQIQEMILDCLNELPGSKAAPKPIITNCP